MVDTLKIQAAPRCLAGLAEVAAVCARQNDEHLTHVLQIVSHFPLDVETVSRMLERMEDRDGMTLLQRDQMTYLWIDDPDSYHVEHEDLESGAHLEDNATLQRHLQQLCADTEWRRKTREQHELLCHAAAARTRTLDLSYFTRRMNVPGSRIQSMLNDLGACGHIRIEIDDEADDVRYTFPTFSYPRARLQRHLAMLEPVASSAAAAPGMDRSPSWIAMLVVVVVCAAALLILGR
jgi:hypothetical protein